MFALKDNIQEADILRLKIFFFWKFATIDHNFTTAIKIFLEILTDKILQFILTCMFPHPS